jgi:hypothetical protein
MPIEGKLSEMPKEKWDTATPGVVADALKASTSLERIERSGYASY